MPNPNIVRIAERIGNECGPWGTNGFDKMKCESILQSELAILKSERDAAVSRCAVCLELAEDILDNNMLTERDIEIVCLKAESILANPNPAAQALLRDRERLEVLSDMFPERTHWILRDNAIQKVNTVPSGVKDYKTLRDLADAVIAAGADHE